MFIIVTMVSKRTSLQCCQSLPGLDIRLFAMSEDLATLPAVSQCRSKHKRTLFAPGTAFLSSMCCPYENYSTYRDNMASYRCPYLTKVVIAHHGRFCTKFAYINFVQVLLM